MKNIRNFAVLLTLVAGAVAANAQTYFQGKFQLTTETRWGKAVLPAGQYSFTMDSVQSFPATPLCVTGNWLKFGCCGN